MHAEIVAHSLLAQGYTYARHRAYVESVDTGASYGIAVALIENPDFVHGLDDFHLVFAPAGLDFTHVLDAMAHVSHGADHVVLVVMARATLLDDDSDLARPRQVLELTQPQAVGLQLFSITHDDVTMAFIGDDDTVVCADNAPDLPGLQRIIAAP